MCKSLKATYTFNHKIKLRDCSHIMSSQRGAGVFVVCVCVGGGGGGWVVGGWEECVSIQPKDIMKKRYEKTKKVELILVKT